MQAIRRWLHTNALADPIARQIAVIVQILILFGMSTTLLSLVSGIVSAASGVAGAALLAAPVALAGYGASLWLVRSRPTLTPGVTLLSAMLLLVLFGGTFSAGRTLAALFLPAWALPVVWGAMLLPRRHVQLIVGATITAAVIAFGIPRPDAFAQDAAIAAILTASTVFVFVAVLISRFGTIMRDAITRQIATQAENDQLHAERDAHAVATIAHELKNALSRARYAAETLNDAAHPSDDAAAWVSAEECGDAYLVATAAHDEILDLTQSLMDGARLRAGALPLNRAALDFGGVTVGAIAGLRRLARIGDVAITIRPLPQLPIVGDGVLIARVIRNLLSNSIHAIGNTPAFDESTGTIVIEGGYTDRGWPYIRITDSGTGMTPEQLATVGTPFVTTGGNGLGTHFCKGVIAAHDGTIDWESIGHGFGTTVTIALPLATEVR